jgi:hypothetical protein
MAGDTLQERIDGQAKKTLQDLLSTTEVTGDTEE